MDELMKHGPDLMLNICASPFDYDHDDDREEIIRANVLKYQLPMFYCNAVGSQTEIVFDGGSLVMDAKGHVVKELKHFEEDFAVISLSDVGGPLSEIDANAGQRIPANEQRPTANVSAFDKDMRVSKIADPDKI